MRSLGSSGVWEIFIPGRGARAIATSSRCGPANGDILLKIDPFGFRVRGAAAVGVDRHPAEHEWNDAEWMARASATAVVVRAPMAIYEVHLGSWARVPRTIAADLTYRELAEHG